MKKKNLVIVESNAKAKTIEKYLSASEELRAHGTFHVVASMGHVVDLPPKEMGIDLETWEMKYVPIVGKGDIIQKLRGLIKSHDMVYLAADPDREGEAIAKNLYDILKLRVSTTKRVTFHEITKRAITTAIQNPRIIDQHMVDAQEARRILDRIVGYKLSPLLWRRFASSGLSAGRVQSVALKMLVDRAKEIEAFSPTPVWKVHGAFEMGETPLETALEEPVRDKKAVESLMRELAKKGGKAGWRASFTVRESKSNPSAPFITSTLQQEAYTKHGIPAKRTMQLAQALYEEGHITYMRTDSTNLSDDAKKAIHNYISEKYGSDHVVERNFKTRVANAQEAHECIRPTHVEKTSHEISSDKLTADHRKIYDLIWRRAVASQMPPAVYLELKTSVKAPKADMPVLDGRAFEGIARVLIEKGYLKVWQPDAEIQEEVAEKLRERAKQSQEISVVATDFKADGDMTRPSSLYNEPSLVKALEKEGIGRPSTYATIIDKLFAKGYVARGTNPQSIHHVVHYRTDLNKKQVTVEEATIALGGKETDRMVPTSLGQRVSLYLEEVAPKMVDVKFTAGMEELLDHISNKEIKKVDMLNEFYQGFEDLIKKALEIQKEASKDVRRNPKEPGELKPKNVLRQITEDANIVQTRYGPALFLTSEKRFISVLPFLKWRGKTIDEITKKDLAFLEKLPIVLQDPQKKDHPIEILIGQYGLYAKKDDANYRIPREIWNNFYEKDGISYAEVSKSLVATKKGKKN